MRRWLPLLLLAAPLAAHDLITTNLTWSQEVSRIVLKRCSGCHQERGRAMPLLTYEQARPWAKAIRDEVLARRMPPWDAVKGVGEFQNDPSLSQPELDILVEWVEGGAPKGDDVYLPGGVPKDAPVDPEWKGRTLAVTGGTVLKQRTQIAGIVPQPGQFELAAIKPDGSVERLLWIRQSHAKQPRPYVLRAPVALPAGTRLELYGGSATLWVGR